MAEDDTTHFQCDLGGIYLELSGERAFVEQMYRLIIRDVELVRSIGRGEASSEHQSHTQSQPREPEISVWIHACSEMMRKIYMSSAKDLQLTFLGQTLSMEGIHTIYVNKDHMHRAFPWFDKGSTLWSEFTETGRQQISAATGGKVPALSNQPT